MGVTKQPHVLCEVTGAEKLAGSIGGEPAICAAFERAAIASGQKFGVKIQVLGDSRMSAQVTTAAGKVMPVVHFGSSDRAISPSALDRFASHVAGEAAKAGSN